VVFAPQDRSDCGESFLQLPPQLSVILEIQLILRAQIRAA